MQPDAATIPSRRRDALQAPDIEKAMLAAAHNYFEDCRRRVPAFVDSHFRYPGAWKTNRVALGLDILRAPVNLMWAPLFALSSLLKWIAQKFNWLTLHQLLERTPAGLTTRVQRHTANLIYRDLLVCDARDSLLEDYLMRELQAVCIESGSVETGSVEPTAAELHRLRQQLEPLIEDALLQYDVTRTATADITNTLACTVLGALAWQKFTPGGIGLGFLLAALWARRQAASDFWLGETLGNLYYRLLPPQPDLSVTLVSVSLVLMGLAALASFSGLVSDPLQSALGIHRRRLNKMLNHLQADFVARTSGGFRPKDQFIARVLEVFDLFKSNLVPG